jgi:myo-inositol-1(or 4)-monophosphatase
MNYKGIALKAAMEAGKILKANFSGQSYVEGKGLHDIVTQSDRQSELVILNILQEHFPDFTYVAEESGTYQTDSDYIWYIDPLDGTSNFATGNPYFSVSLALAYRRSIILGVVYNPIVNELYTAEKGEGAFLNNTQIHVNKKDNLSDALISSAFSASEADIKHGLKTIEKLAMNCRKVVVNFSPALDLCNVARGRMDGVVSKGTTPEDHAAGSLILIESGGIVENFDNKVWSVNEKGIIASNGRLQNLIANIVR